MRLLMFHPALAPYRLDWFNALAKRCELRLIFLQDNLATQRFDQEQLCRGLSADHGYLSDGFSLRKVVKRNDDVEEGQLVIRVGVHREINRFCPDVVVTTEFSPTTWSVLIGRSFAARPYAHVLCTDDNPASVALDSRSRVLSRALALPRIDGLIVISEDAAKLYRERYRARAPIGISPLVQDEAVFRERLAAAGEDARKIMSAHNLTGKRVLLFVGRLAPGKRVDRLVRAFAEQSNRFPDAVLAVVGDGGERSNLEALAQTSGVAEKVLFVGRKEDTELYAWYRVAALFVLPSSYERFGAVVNEALLSGVPVVCSDRAGAKVLIREGETGAIVDTADASALSEALREWVGRVRPLDGFEPSALRPLLMSASFADAVDAFLNVANASSHAQRTNRRGAYG
jgi:glycosyltransferase involved in cell wall biosynthesis